MPSKRAIGSFLLGVLVLAHPVVGNGPGAETHYTYTTNQVNLSNDEAVEMMYHAPEVAYGTGTQTEAVRNARNDTVVRPESAVGPELRALTDVQYLADDAHDQYYRINASVADGAFRLRATAVSANVIAERVAVAPETASPIVQKVLDGRKTASKRVNATLVVKNGRYLMVRPVETKRVPDPFAIVKVAGYALGVALVIWAVVIARHRDDSGTP